MKVHEPAREYFKKEGHRRHRTPQSQMDCAIAALTMLVAEFHTDDIECIRDEIKRLKGGKP